MTPPAGGPRIIAEIGSSHAGDIDRARELIAAAREAGADAAKFQLIRADEILHPATGVVELPTGAVRLYDRFKALERPTEFYVQLLAACREADIDFLCTPFGIESACELKEIGMREVKIASPELNHHPLIREVTDFATRVIVSAGVASLADIAESLALIPPSVSVTLLQCVTSYPAPEEDYNLRVIPTLRQALGPATGVSDHTSDAILVPALATLLGATVIEKHITLSRTGEGLDDPIALPPSEFRRMVVTVKQIAERLDDSAVHGAEARAAAEAAIAAEIRARFGKARVERVLGDGIKGIAPSETDSYGYTNRSIHARGAVPAGTRLTSDNLAVLRTERNLTAGLHPRYWDTVLGARVVRSLDPGDGLHWNHLLSP